VEGNYTGIRRQLATNTCTALNIANQAKVTSDHCIAIVSDGPAIVFLCSFNTEAKLRLVAVSRASLSSPSGKLDSVVTFGLVMEYIESDLDATFSSASALTLPSTVRKVSILIVLYGSRWGGAIFICAEAKSKNRAASLYGARRTLAR
jgi:hypothetical protein